MQTEYKIILIGDGGCGKTSFVNCLRKGEFSGKYIPTQALMFHLSLSTLIMVRSSSKFGLRWARKVRWFERWLLRWSERCFAYVRFGLIEYLYVLWKVGKRCWRVVGDIPIVVCCNKIDALNRKITEEMVKETLPKTVPYFNVSAKINYNIQTPLLELAKKLTGYSDWSLQKINKHTSFLFFYLCK